MNKPHKHAELIKAWADGATIEYYSDTYKRWVETEPIWSMNNKYRIKPAEKVVRWQWITVCEGSKPQISRSFFTEQEALNGFHLGVKLGAKLIGKAEWTRMEFDK